MRSLLALLEQLLTRSYNFLVFMLSRAVLVDVYFQEVVDGRRKHTPKRRLAPVPLFQAEFIFKQQEQSITHNDDKSKLILTLSVALNTFLIAFRPASAPWGLLLSVAVALTASIILSVELLRVRPSARPDPVPAVDDINGTLWSSNLLEAAEVNARSHAFRVDIYDAARRWFLLAFFLSLSVVAQAPRTNLRQDLVNRPLQERSRQLPSTDEVRDPTGGSPSAGQLPGSAAEPDMRVDTTRDSASPNVDTATTKSTGTIDSLDQRVQAGGPER